MNPHCPRLETTSAKVILRVVFFCVLSFSAGKKKCVFFKQIAVFPLVLQFYVAGENMFAAKHLVAHDSSFIPWSL